MKKPSFYRARIFLFDNLIGKLPVNSQKKNTPRELLKQGYWSPELGDQETMVNDYLKTIKEYEAKPTAGRYSDIDIISISQKIAISTDDPEPLKFSEISKYSTWFAMHPEKIAGNEIVTTSLFFPVKVDGTKDDVIKVVKNGIASLNKPVTSNINLLKMKMKAKALMLLLELNEKPKSKKLRNDNEIVTRQNTNLQKEYDYYNHLCFNGSLINVPLEWNMKKDKLGFVEYHGKRFDLKSYIIDRLSISTFNKITYQSFVDTLVHEMIHVYIISNAIRDDGSHGTMFQKEMKRINNMQLGVNITITGDTSGFEISEEIKPKELVVVLVYKENKPYGIVNYIRALYNDIPRYYNSFSNDFLNRTKFAFKIVLSRNPNLQKYRINNKFNTSKLITTPVPEKLFSELENDRALNGLPETEEITYIRVY